MSGFWLEIFENENGIYICVNRKELDKIYQKVCHLTKQICLHCGHEDCYICKKFKFIYK